VARLDRDAILSAITDSLHAAPDPEGLADVVAAQGHINIAATGADIIVWDHKKIDGDQIAQIHQLGKKAWAYTIDDPQRAVQLVAAGIDGIITNKPLEIAKLRARGQ